MTTTSQQISIASIPVAGISPVINPNQCLVGNQFLFKNASTNVLGSMQYRWILGDGTEASTRDVTYSYPRSGNYKVKMMVSSNAICVDSSIFDITIYQNAIADFNIKPVCIDLAVQATNNTLDTGSSPVNYIWNLGNGQISTLRNPPPQTYSRAGNYPISLSVNTAQCPLPYNTAQRVVVVDKPRTGINYPVQFAVVNFPLTLQARPFGDEVLWSPGTNLSTSKTYTPVFNGEFEQLYRIEITTSSGCVTIDTQLVKTVKEVGMFVPNAFTPNNDGRNDFLRLIVMGIKEVRYFKVFNRWGQPVYEAGTDQRGWDGRLKGVEQQTQTVVWMAEGLGLDGKVYFRKGTAVLLR